VRPLDAFLVLIVYAAAALLVFVIFHLIVVRVLFGRRRKR
jgi:hypothetical protein